MQNMTSNHSTILLHACSKTYAISYRVEEGETVVRTLSDYWVVAKKNGHRRFFVLITQKDVNFAEVNGNEIL